MKILRGYKTELAPNNVQRTALLKTAGCARFAWNWSLALRKKERRETGRSQTSIDHHKILNKLKKTEFPWLYDVTKWAPQEAMRDLDKAMISFYKNLKAGRDPGYPKFKSKRNSPPKFRCSEVLTITPKTIHIPRIGSVRLKEQDYLPVTGSANVRQLSTAVKGTGAGRWFVSVLCEIELPDPASVPVTHTLGIDLGLKDFAVTSEGEHIPHPQYLRKAQRRLRQIQQVVSRRKKGGANRRKAVHRLSGQYFKVACRRRNFLDKLTARLVRTKPDTKFAVEALAVSAMLRTHRLAKSIGDSGWSEFKRQLEYKTDWQCGLTGERAGGRMVKADQWFPSSRMCCKCHGIKHDLTLADRTFICSACGNVMDRDLNAAYNLANYEDIVAVGLWRPRQREKLPLVRREVTPVESTASKAAHRSRNQTTQSCSAASAVGQARKF